MKFIFGQRMIEIGSSADEFTFLMDILNNKTELQEADLLSAMDNIEEHMLYLIDRAKVEPYKMRTRIKEFDFKGMPYKLYLNHHDHASAYFIFLIYKMFSDAYKSQPFVAIRVEY